MSEVIDEPGGGEAGHPIADDGDGLAEEEELEIAVTEGAPGVGEVVHERWLCQFSCSDLTPPFSQGSVWAFGAVRWQGYVFEIGLCIGDGGDGNGDAVGAGCGRGDHLDGEGGRGASGSD